jgi:hypothetical protein
MNNSPISKTPVCGKSEHLFCSPLAGLKRRSLPGRKSPVKNAIPGVKLLKSPHFAIFCEMGIQFHGFKLYVVRFSRIIILIWQKPTKKERQ